MTDPVDSCERLLAAATAAIGGDSPRLDAELLLSYITGWTRTGFRAWPKRAPTPEQVSGFQGLVRQRIEGRPVAHLLGEQEFWSLPLKVNASTLKPSSEAFRVARATASAAASQARILQPGRSLARASAMAPVPVPRSST